MTAATKAASGNMTTMTWKYVLCIHELFSTADANPSHPKKSPKEFNSISALDDQLHNRKLPKH